MRRPFRVGRNCEAWCTRCRAATEHTIIAMVGNLPKRVQCATCDGQHNYRAPGGRTPARAGPVAPAPRGRQTSLTTWQARIAEKANAGAEARVYAIETTFSDGDVIEHPTFGVGTVEKVLPGDKIEVLFSVGIRLLAHGRG